jgi:hypothetical protein
VKLDARWEFEAPPGGKDTELAVFCGTRSRIEVRQGREENFVPQVFVIPNRREDGDPVGRALGRCLGRLSALGPGLAVRENRQGFQVVIPEALRVGHEEHFALLVRQFLGYLRHPGTLPAWESPNLLAKYYVTTAGLDWARKQSGHPPARERNSDP